MDEEGGVKHQRRDSFIAFSVCEYFGCRVKVGVDGLKVKSSSFSLQRNICNCSKNACES